MINNLIKLISKDKNVVIFGDLVIDKYINVTSNRLSSECKIPVMNKLNSFEYLGCAGNVCRIINEFNCNVYLISAINKKSNVTKLCKQENINIDYSILINNYNQKKKRYINENSQYFRIDNCDILNYNKYKNIIEQNLIECFNNNKIDLLIISDYNNGFCSNLDNIIKIAKDKNIKIIVDPHGYNLKNYDGCDFIKPNKKEIQQLSGISIKNDDDIIRCANKIFEDTSINNIITTNGEKGILYFKRNENVKIFPTNKINFIDVCGAGDTINSLVSLGLICNLSIEHICELANKFASIFISKIGTSKLYFYEIFKYLNKTNIVELDNLIILTQYLKKYKNLKIGITTGCFDLFHAGHIKSLKYAKERCDILILLLNSDNSIKLLKGDKRPINNLFYRKELLKELNIIDIITVFDTKDANPILEKLNFNILFKGGDYDMKKLNDQFPEVNIILSEFEKGISSSSIINKVSNIIKK